jgi:hypothetical protein
LGALPLSTRVRLVIFAVLNAYGWSATQVTAAALLGVSCSSGLLCVAGDVDGDLLATTDPDGGASDWPSTNVDGTNAIEAVSCQSAPLCVAVDDAGNVLSSTDPTGGASTWHAAHVDGTNALNGVACPSTTLCVAVDDAGNVVASTDPAGGTAAWSVASVDPGTSLNAVSCSSPSQCVAVDTAGNEVNSINPAGGDAAWTDGQVSFISVLGYGTPVTDISCPGEAFCVAVDPFGNAFVGDPTPSNLAAPAIDGGAVVGRTIVEAHGVWTDSPTSLDVAWERCTATGDNCSQIGAASGQSYTVTAADLGRTIRAVEVASNASGAGTPIESDQSAIVTAPSPTVLPPHRLVTTAKLGDQQITLTTPSPLACNTTRLAATVNSTTIAKSKASKLTFVSVAFYIDKGVKHTGHRTEHARKGKKKVLTITYAANATEHHVPVTVDLSLAGLKPGTHNLKVVVSYRETERAHRHKKTTPFSKTLKVKFTVC